MSDLRKDIEEVINKHCAENGSNTPNFILADYLVACLRAYDDAVKAKDKWYGVSLSPGCSQDGKTQFAVVNTNHRFPVI